jgi:hypothetical protein
MLTRYDPERAPDPRRWLATPEADRIELARRFHRRAGIRPPREQAHAVFHAVVETQVAMGDETPAAETLQRLMGEGLTRHDAVHAIGFVLAEHMTNLLKEEEGTDADPNERYFQSLRELTADRWRQSAAEGEAENRGIDDG